MMLDIKNYNYFMRQLGYLDKRSKKTLQIFPVPPCKNN